MWRRLYLLLIGVRLYFALQPSYIHPDEHFQGPEIIAGEIFGWPSHKTWEFTSSHPIRSIFPLWIFYGFPLTIWKWIWEGLGYGAVPPNVAFYGLRTLMFLLSFVLEDWALHELVPARRERTHAILLAASSYVTWTFQTHTFSNSIETLLVLWCLVLIRRIREQGERTMAGSCSMLAFLGVTGVFNRITFPAFLLLPLAQLVLHLFKRRLRIPIMLVVGLATLVVGITTDTEFYRGTMPLIRSPLASFIFTPWNNLAYNFDPSNLAEHGLHPFWQHFLVNLPQLIGPAFPLLLFSSRRDSLFWSAITGIVMLSCFRHQEPRFLLPAVPLLLASLRPPSRYGRLWMASWVLFNVLGGVLFGIYHQGGVVPAQVWLSDQADVTQVFWWKTYSPPRWLLDGMNEHVTTIDLMGARGHSIIDQIIESATCETQSNRTLFLAPTSATFLDQYVENVADSTSPITLHELWRHRRHIGLDDLDFGDDGIGPTLQRVVGRRGLVIWQVEKRC